MGLFARDEMVPDSNLECSGVLGASEPHFAFSLFPMFNFDIIFCKRFVLPLDLSNETVLDAKSGGPSARKSTRSLADLDNVGASGGPSARKSIKSRVLCETFWEV